MNNFKKQKANDNISINVRRNSIYGLLLSEVELIADDIGIIANGKLWYYSFSAMQEVDKVFLYLQILSVLFPTLIGIVMAVVSEVEQSAAGCQLLLIFPGSKYSLHSIKIVVIMGFGLFASMLAAVGFGVGFIGLGYTALSLSFFGVLFHVDRDKYSLLGVQ